jgi:hypothetical protein
MHKFQLETADGKQLGPVELQRPDWPVGSIIYKGGAAPDLLVVGQRYGEERTVLVVEELPAARSHQDA